MNNASLKTSPRLQKLACFLISRGERGATGAEIFANCGMLNPATHASEMNADLRERHAPERIVCTYQGRTPTGAKLFKYTWNIDGYKTENCGQENAA